MPLPNNIPLSLSNDFKFSAHQEIFFMALGKKKSWSGWWFYIFSHVRLIFDYT